MLRRIFAAFTFLFLLSMASATVRSAETLPSQIPDTQFWQMVTDYSEPDGYFQFENFVSAATGGENVSSRYFVLASKPVSESKKYRFRRSRFVALDRTGPDVSKMSWRTGVSARGPNGSEFEGALR